MINTLYLSYDGLTDPLGQSQILPYLFGLSKNNNCKITIISFEKNENFQLNHDLIKSKLKEKNIHWIPLKYSKRPPIISTLWDIYKLYKAVNKLIKSGVNLIHCRSYITSIVALKRLAALFIIFVSSVSV